MNTFSLVNALILTIPFGVVSGFNSQFWDAYEQQMDAYGCADQFWSRYYNLEGENQAVVYCATGGLVLAVFYYVLRPSPENKPDPQLADICVAMAHTNETLQHLTTLMEAHLSDDAESKSKISKAIKGGGESTRKSLMHQESVKIVEEESKLIDNAFRAWWLRGRVVIFMIFTFTAIGVICILSLIATLFGSYIIPSNFTCVGGQNHNRINGGIFGVLFCTVLTIYLLI